MANLNDKQKNIIQLRDKDGLSLKEIAERTGFKYETVKNYYHTGKRLMRAGEIVPEETKVVPKPTEMADKLEIKAEQIINSINKVNIGTASLYQRASSITQLITTARLLRGESTQNITIEDKRQLNELLPILMQEAKRRMITLEGEFSVET